MAGLPGGSPQAAREQLAQQQQQQQRSDAAAAGDAYSWLGQSYANQYNNYNNYADRASPYLQGIQDQSAATAQDLANRSSYSGEMRTYNLDATGRGYGGQLSNVGQGYGAELANAGGQAAAGLYGVGNAAQGYGAQQGGDLASYGTWQGAALGSYGAQQAADLQRAGTQAAAGLQDYGTRQQEAIANSGYTAMDLGLRAQNRAGPALNFGQQNQYLQGAQQNAANLGAIEQQEGPSAAQAQLQSALNQTQASNIAMARSGRGWGGSTQAASQAQAQNAAAGQQAANQSAMLRAQEQAAFRQRQAANQQAAGALQTNLGQQAMGQQALGAQTALQSRAQNDAYVQGMYGLGTNALAQGAQAGLGAAGQAAQLGVNAQQGAAQIGTNALAQGASLGAQSMQQGAALGLEGYGQQQQAYGQAAQNALAGIQGGGQLALQGLSQGAGAELQGQQAAAANELAGYGQASQIANAGYGMGLTAEQQRAQIYGSQQQIEQQYAQSALQQYAADAGVSTANAQTTNQMAGAGIGAGGALLAALPLMLSDRNLKEGIEPANGRLLEPAPGQIAASRASQDASRAAGARAAGMNAQPSFLSNLGSAFGGAMQNFGGQLMSDKREKEAVRAVENTPGYSYDYKNPDEMGAEPGRQYGVMAQDLEKTPAGRSVVTRTPDGRRMVDTSRLTMVNTAALNAMQRHIDELESMMSSRRKAA